MAKNIDVYGLGNALVDLQLRVEEADISKLGLTKAGMTLVDTLRQKELLEYFQGKHVHQASGGSAANTVIALAQLGAKSAYGCLVAKDRLGSFYREQMQELGVSLTTNPAPHGDTGTCVVLITPDAERTMNTHLGVSAEFSAEHVSEASIAAARWLYIEGYLFSSESGQAAVKKATQFAKKHGTKIALTMSDRFIVECFRAPLTEAISSCALVFGNLLECGAFTGCSDPEGIFAAMKEVTPHMVMTLGEQGAWVSSSERDVRVSAFPVSAIDDTGAGDMFAGAYLAGILRGLPEERAAKLGCYLASRVVSGLGPRLSGDLLHDMSVSEILSHA